MKRQVIGGTRTRIWGIVKTVILFALLSTSPQFIFGVDAAPAAMIGGVLGGMGIAMGSAEAERVVPVLTFYVGIWLLRFALLRAGRVLRFVSTSVMGGFISGICCTIILMQLPKLMGGTAGTGELPELVRLCEMSLQSERKTLDLLEQECTRQEKPHAVIIMADLGDLREGYWDHEEMVQTCLYVERRLPHVHLSGVGVNLSCYGSVRATPEKMQMLLAIARRVEDAIGRPLEIISGGATSSYPMIHTGTMPAGINHLRIGENILTAQDIADSWGIHDADYLRDDVFRLEAEVVEVKEKPTYPQGELGADAFGRKPVYEDRGLRLRAILALGRADVGDMETLRPTMPGVTVIGGSSDHCILDVTDAPQPVQVGDVLSFRLCYSHVLYATQRDDVPVVVCP